jgi:hypothetical protein
MKRNLILAALVAATAGLILAAAASGAREVVRVGNLFLADNGGLIPSRLPSRERAPVRARLIGEVGTVDGSHPPALRTVDLDVDRSVRVDAVGLPICGLGEITSRSTADARRACGAAIVGSGEAEVEVAFPEQRPFSAKGPLLLFNGGVRGATTTLFLHAYVAIPAPTAIIVPVTLTRIHRDRFGLSIHADVPRIAGGAGSVTRFELDVGRAFTHRGARRSFLSANCPSGKYVTRGDVHFDDGTEMGINHVFPCTPEATQSRRNERAAERPRISRFQS